MAVDLLTLSHNTDNIADHYAPLTCFGAYGLDTASGEVSAIIAKKTVLATGGAHAADQLGVIEEVADAEGRALLTELGMPFRK